MGHVSNYPGVSENNGTIPEPLFQTGTISESLRHELTSDDEEILRLFEEGWNDNPPDDSSGNALSELSDITSLIHDDDEKYGFNLPSTSSTFETCVFDRVFRQTDFSDVRQVDGISAHDQTPNESEKEKLSTEYNCLTVHCSTNTFEQSETNNTKNNITQKEQNGERKRQKTSTEAHKNSTHIRRAKKRKISESEITATKHELEVAPDPLHEKPKMVPKDEKYGFNLPSTSGTFETCVFDLVFNQTDFSDDRQDDGNSIHDKTPNESEKEKLSTEYNCLTVHCSTKTFEQSETNNTKNNITQKKQNGGRKRQKTSTEAHKNSTHIRRAKKRKISESEIKASKHKFEVAPDPLYEKPKMVPKLIIKLDPKKTDKYKAETLQDKSEIFAPTIADKVKTGRRGQNGNISFQDFRKVFSNSEEALKRKRKCRQTIKIKENKDTAINKTTQMPITFSLDSYSTSKSDISPECTPQVTDDNSISSKDGALQEITGQALDTHKIAHEAPEIIVIPRHIVNGTPEIILDEECHKATLIDVKRKQVHLTDESSKCAEFEENSRLYSIPDINDYKEYFELSSQFDILAPDREMELGELPDAPSPIPETVMAKTPKVPSSSVLPARKISKVPVPEVKAEKLILPFVPLRSSPIVNPKLEIMQRRTFVDNSYSGSRSPLSMLLPHTSSSYMCQKRQSSSSSSSNNSSSSHYRYDDQFHRSPSFKRNKSDRSKKSFCKRCHRFKLDRPIKYDSATGVLTDEFGRELRPSEKEEFEKSCHCKFPNYKNQGIGKHRSRTSSRDDRRRRKHNSRSRSRSSNCKYSRVDSRERLQRSPSLGCRNNSHGQDKPIEERRVVYVGNMSPDITEEILRERFITFGPIEDIQIKSNCINKIPKFFGFITFRNREDACNAKENGNKDPLKPQFDLNYGGRRKFCDGIYTDLDGNAAESEDEEDEGYTGYKRKRFSKKKRDFLFEDLLQIETNRLISKGVTVNIRYHHS